MDLQPLLPVPFRANNQCLMDVVATLPKARRAQLQAFTRVRLYLGVQYLSEIASADGSSIARDAWAGERPRSSPLLWPYQPKPGPQSFRAWRGLLATAFLHGHRRQVSVRTRDLKLRDTLGA
jgi:hypothetical protein